MAFVHFGFLYNVGGCILSKSSHTQKFEYPTSGRDNACSFIFVLRPSLIIIFTHCKPLCIRNLKVHELKTLKAKMHQCSKIIDTKFHEFGIRREAPSITFSGRLFRFFILVNYSCIIHSELRSENSNKKLITRKCGGEIISKFLITVSVEIDN